MPVPANDSATAEPQTLDEILDWRLGIVDALMEQHASVHQLIRRSMAVLPRFVGMSEQDVDTYYDAQRRELDRLTTLNLVASAEAAIKIDFFRRVRNRLKDPLADAYRKWHKDLPAKKKDRPDFDEGGILDVLKQTKLMDNHLIGQFRECLRARHWIGHGRYWDKPAGVDQLDPDDVFSRADALLKGLPA